jgi:muramidase (phage lysozyme)
VTGLANLEAFLAMVRVAEGTALQPDPYAVTFGYRFVITDFSDHPALRGWPGVKLSDRHCRGAGLKPGCKSTAAGAYQAVLRTWIEEKKRCRLPDFTRGSQDAFARARIRYRGALDDVLFGRLPQALTLCRREWASLPGAGYDQLERTRGELLAAYTDAGGWIA